MTDDQRIRAEIVEVGQRMYRKGLIAAADGNITVRTPDDRIYATPSGACKGDLVPTDMVVTDRRGAVLEGSRKPSSELEMHLAIYDVRPDVFAVVHAHPPLATGFAAAGVPLSPALLSEVVLTLGCVPLTEYATPTTSELADTLRSYARGHDALLLANHGAVALGRTALDAYFKMETLEHYAKINLVTKVLGSERRLPADAVDKLRELRRKAGLADNDPLCSALPPPNHGDTLTLTREELVNLIVRVVESTDP